MIHCRFLFRPLKCTAFTLLSPNFIVQALCVMSGRYNSAYSDAFSSAHLQCVMLLSALCNKAHNSYKIFWSGCRTLVLLQHIPFTTNVHSRDGMLAYLCACVCASVSAYLSDPVFNAFG
uniref:Secreted protein n=1 Tax=Parascaris univalens TaxID=6257 RepID=A0A915BJQ7_PARUN